MSNLMSNNWCVQFCRTVVVLDCDVTTLVEQWGYVLHVFGGSVEG